MWQLLCSAGALLARWLALIRLHALPVCEWLLVSGRTRSLRMDDYSLRLHELTRVYRFGSCLARSSPALSLAHARSYIRSRCVRSCSCTLNALTTCVGCSPAMARTLYECVAAWLLLHALSLRVRLTRLLRRVIFMRVWRHSC